MSSAPSSTKHSARTSEVDLKQRSSGKANSTVGRSPDARSSTPDTTSIRESLFTRLKSLIGLKNGSIRQDLQVALANDSFTDDHFNAEERLLLHNILSLRDTRVEDVMIPRAEIDAAPVTTSLAELLRQFREAGHSRMPVFGETLDDPTGMIHIKDLMRYITETAHYQSPPEAKRKKKLPGNLDLRQVDLSILLADTKLVRPLLFVPPFMKVGVLLAKMQAARIQMALVIDEYGGTDGLVSLEDLVETIVGDIEDEHDDKDTPNIVAESENSFIAEAKADLKDVVALIGPEFEIGPHSEDVDTLGGLIFNLVGRIPIRGELINGPGPFEIEVLEADPRRIKRLRIYRRRRKRMSGKIQPYTPRK